MTSSNGKKRKIRAGQAYLEASANDPIARQALFKLRMFAESIQAAGAPLGKALTALRRVFAVLERQAPSGLEELQAERERAFAELADQIQESLQAAKADLAARGFEPPGSGWEDWEHLARIVEKEPGPLTLGEIYRWAIAWADREKVRLRLAKAEASPPKDDEKPQRADPTTENDAGVRRDPHDDRIAWCMGTRIYLGNDTQVSRLFWLLASPVGRACSLGEVQRAVDGMETNADLGVSAAELRKAGQRVRKVISRLRKALREWGADAHLLIVRGGSAKDPEYTMVFRHARKS
jgi:hypothetical protein